MKLPRGFSHPVRIGKGAFSMVVRARQEKLDRPVALKMIPSRRDGIAAVEREARILASVTHPCVPRIHDIFHRRAAVVIVMEWVYGVPLSRLIERDVDDGLKRAVASDLVHALTLLHGGGIAHRDLKPENVIVTPDRGVCFVDFGFSSLGKASPHADASTLRGTPAFMAPELWAHQERIDFLKADLYSLGVILQRLLGSNLPECAEALLRSDPALRPADCASFEQCWSGSLPPGDRGPVQARLADAAAEYTAGLLFESARELFTDGRGEEAYALLTESLEAWPDNSEALDFLQSRFSSPLRYGRPRRIAAWAAAALFALLALATAYLSGMRAREQTVVAGYRPDDDTGERRLLPAGTSDNRSQAKNMPPIPMEIASGGELFGTVSVIVPGGGGTLFIDNRPQPPPGGNRATAATAAGTHRVEWFDSASGRRRGETVDVPPFSVRTVSLRRFANGR